MQKTTRTYNTYFTKKLSLRSKASQSLSKYALDSFNEFLVEKYESDINKVINDMQDQELAFEIIQAWINWHNSTQRSLKGGKKYIPSPNTTFLYYRCIIKYLHYMGIKFHPLDLKQEISLPIISHKEKHGISINEIKILLHAGNFKQQAKILAQLSSGMRIGELVQLRKKHLNLTMKRIMVKIPAELTKKQKARTTFFSKEFSDLYRHKINTLKDEDLIFPVNEKWIVARDNEIESMRNLTQKAGLKEITTHSLRAYFISKVSRIDHNLAKKFAGHTGYQLDYDRTSSDDEKLEQYLKIEPELLIYENEKNTDDEYMKLAKLFAQANPEFLQTFKEKLTEFKSNNKL